MEYLLKHPIFWIGVVVGMVLAIVIWTYKSCRKDNFRGSYIYNGKLKTEKMLEAMREGKSILLDEYFSSKNKKQPPVGYCAWKSFAFWLASKYADCQFTDNVKAEFWKLIEVCFGTGAAYIKMQALDELINRSTNYYLNGGRAYRSYEKRDLSRLYEMVDMIIDSFAPEVYEQCRRDKQ